MFSRGHLYKILDNPIYAGRLKHKTQVHQGQHPAIINVSTWRAVQDALAANHHQHRRQRSGGAHLLVGRIRDAAGVPVVPSHTQKGSLRYRYYVARDAAPGVKRLRLPAAPIETAVVIALQSVATTCDMQQDEQALIAAELDTVTVHHDHLSLRLSADRPAIKMPFVHHPQQRRREIIVPPGREGEWLRPMKTEDRKRLLRAIARGRAWMRELMTGQTNDTKAIAAREGLSERSVRMTLSLAQLAPSIVTAIVEARLTRGIGQRHLCELPVAWTAQERALGF